MTTPGWNGPQQHPYGHQPPPGWGVPPGYPPQPPKKKRTGLLITLIAIPVVLLLGAGLTVFLIYQDAHKDGGSPPTGARLGQACAAVSQETLAKLRTTNPDPELSREQEGFTACSWVQTQGKDGEGHRRLTFQVLEPGTPAGERQPKCEGNVLAPPRIGDQACLSIKNYSASSREGQLQFTEGGKFVLVQYEGWDIGLFDTVPMPENELTQTVLDVGNEVRGKLGSR